MFTDDKILKFADEVKRTKKNIAEMRASGKYDKAYLMKRQQELEDAAREELKAYYDDLQAGYEQKMEEVRKAHESKPRTLDDNIAELLKRQDIELQLKLASNEDLKDQVNQFKDSGAGELSQLNMLRMELKNRNLTTEEITVKAYMDEYQVATPYKRDEKYQAAAEKVNLINAVRNTGHIHVGEGELKEVISLKME
jgi:hypothetical protein